MDNDKLLSNTKQLFNDVYAIIEKNNNSKNRNDCIFASYARAWHNEKKEETLVCLIDNKEYELFDELVNIIHSQENFYENYTIEDIKSLLYELFHYLLLKKIEVNEELIIKLYHKLITNTNKKWLVLTEVENLKIEENLVFDLIGSRIKIIDAKDIEIDKNILQKHPFIIGKDTNPLDVPNLKKQTFKPQVEKQYVYPLENEDLVGKVGIYTDVTAGSTYKAKELALLNFKVTLGLLNLFLRYTSLSLRENRFEDDQEIHLIDKSTSRHTIHFDNPKPNISETLIKDDYDYLKESGAFDLNPKSGIGKVVKECLYWYSSAKSEKESASKLVHYVTILETTLKHPGDKSESTLKLKDRCALLLGENFEERKKIADDISKIYDIRSKIVHTGNTTANEYYVKLAEKYITAILLELIHYNHEYSNDFSTFIKMLDDKKYKYFEY